MEDGPYKEKCLQLLKDGAAAVADDALSLSTATSCSLVFVDSVSDAGGSYLYDNSNSGRPRKPNSSEFRNMSALITQKDWKSVLEMVEDDPACASKWLYGIDKDKTMVAPLVWKRLPIHLAAAYVAPVGILQILVRSFPDGAATPDPHSGCLPLHTVCQKGGPDCLESVRFLLETCPTATKAVDMQGRLPLHLAVLTMTPYPVVELLVEKDPQSAVIVDGNGKSALEYSLQTYGRQHMVTELLSMVLEFDHLKSTTEGNDSNSTSSK